MVWIRIVHVLGIIFWMGGLLILSRMLAYHVKEELPIQDRLGRIEKRLYWGVAIPGLLLALITGIWMLIDLQMVPLKNPAFHIKLTAVIGLIVLHFIVQKMLYALIHKPEKQPAGKYKLVHTALGALLVTVLISIYLVYRGG